MIKFPNNIAKLSVQNIIDILQCNFKILGNINNIVIDNASSIDNANEKSIVFISETRNDKLELLKKTKSKLIICNITEIKNLEFEKCLIIVESP